MKKIFTHLFLFVLVAGVLSACAPEPPPAPTTAVAQTLVALPDDATTLIAALVTAGVAYLLLKVNMGQYTQTLAAAISPIIITVIEGWLGLIPPIFDNLVLSILHLLVLFVGGSVGSFLLFKRAKQPKQLLE
jgi:Na+-transporting methylmalonyl-CoA/oxaloacetate decarboxylase gamma subunit